jgi:uncharacterized membrane protein
MSARDWSTVGAEASLPRWVRWAIPPPLIPLAAMAWIAAHWDRIPLRFATHFGKGGRPDGWTTRTPLHVYGVLIFGAGLAALLVGLVFAIWYTSRRRASTAPESKVLLAVAYLLSIVFTTIGLMPLVQIPPEILVVIILVVVLGMIVYAVRAQSAPEDTPDDTPKECWSLGGIYYNPKDPSLFVPARIGYGYTFNMANPWSYRIIIGFFVGIGLLIAFLIWSLR